jgi:hypothetical protein
MNDPTTWRGQPVDERGYPVDYRLKNELPKRDPVRDIAAQLLNAESLADIKAAHFALNELIESETQTKTVTPTLLREDAVRLLAHMEDSHSLFADSRIVAALKEAL